ncbi:P-loop containing nucleoside triphosphate hydrolase protein [Xylona heveae TC161]|uniref:p-loop containing nucleoside triphosphate hydrolase protein n=1 Tax=Xylona heveae (strain CBS 132557 / TC161) TaxID=1328760 RepID=A0A165IUH3_XYLHT|nr:P-loop containing nucleoside triphosphate hydrolase protein [Xylona heveae TC161]KZF25406.1 P-loop containing nucleoside triphosphate hydrolase protein [Xylona heveae TC161]
MEATHDGDITNDAGSVGDSDAGERPVREKFKKTSIASGPNPDLPPESSAEGEKPASSELRQEEGGERGRSTKKRSFDDLEAEAAQSGEATAEKEERRTRKRSRDMQNEAPDQERSASKDLEGPAIDVPVPKRKRSREQFDKDSVKAAGQPGTEEKVLVETNEVVEESRPGRAANDEPEKKRHRDTSQEPEKAKSTETKVGGFSNTSAISPFGALAAKKSPSLGGASSSGGNVQTDKAETSAEKFAASGFGALASSAASPFGTLAASSGKASPFATLNSGAGNASQSGTSFGSGFGSSASGFGKLGTGFGSSFGGGGLKSFASHDGPGVIGISDKPAKPFGAPPDDEEEEEAEANGNDEDTPGGSEDAKDKEDKPFRPQAVETGEEGEHTAFSCRCKLYAFTNKEWKERGLGVLKVNVPQTDEESDKESPPARLVMRSDFVHKVILNVPIKDMKLGGKGKSLTLFELLDGKPVPLQLKVCLSDCFCNTFGIRQLILGAGKCFKPRSSARLKSYSHLESYISSKGIFYRRRTGLNASRALSKCHRMTKLRAATVSNKVVRKGKRKASELENGTPTDPASENPSTTTQTVPTKTHDGGKKSRRSGKSASDSTPALVRQDSSNFVNSNVPWPEHFTKLGQIHKALNLVYTFCCTRKHLATTFDNIKSAVESHVKRPLIIADIGQIKALVPNAINFSYVDEASLDVLVEGSGTKVRQVDHFAPLETPDEGSHNGARERRGREVLFFEFIDGDLKRQVLQPKTGKPVNPVRKLREERLKMPVYSQAQMMKMIDKRNTKFTSAVNAFLNQSAADGVDPVSRLEEELSDYIPVISKERSATPARQAYAKLPARIPEERASIADIIKEIKSLEWYTGQIVPDGHRVFDPQPPVHGELEFQLSQTLVNALYNTREITQLYSHQAEAINHLYHGRHVIVSTSTSSGKSLIYQIPVLHELEQDLNTRAMYIFPTKALAQDQRRSLKELMSLMPGLENLVVETFDGDTPMQDRNRIRDEARIIFTNPDMLHITILPQEESWRTFLKNLKYVVVDELHVYNGLFGSHVAFIMRRLRRICAAVGNHHVKFISCSATVANPEEHMNTIFGVDDVELIDFDGSPSGRKEFLCWNTPFKDPADPSSGRGDAMVESAKLFCQLILRGVRVIAFCRVRKQCEVLVGAVKSELRALERPEVMARVMGYRGGYTPQDRRQIEKEMFEGKLLGIIATNALELGIDIGSLDAVITVGFPYSISNLRQQSGRAGRRNKDSLSVLLGDCFPTDQYYMENPDEIFTKPNCELGVDLQNTLVLEGHLQCAAYEMPIRPDEDQIYFGENLPELAQDRLVKDPLGFYHCHERFRPHPSRFVAIRDTEDGHFAVVDITNNRNVVLEEVEPSRAFFTIYEGGVYLHQGQTYIVKEFSIDSRLARVERANIDWTTQQRDYTDVDPIETEAIRRIPDSLSRAFYGSIKVRMVVFGFFKVDKRRRILDAVQVDNPPVEILSKGFWLDVPSKALEILASRRLNAAAAIHAAEHALLSLMPNFVISMPGDVRTECKNALKEFARRETSRKRPARLTFYDAKGGAAGSGISTKAFEFVDLLLHQACDRVAACHCQDGCVECVCSERCKEANLVLSKAGASVILRCLLNLDIDIDSLPWGPEDELTPAGIETIIAAEEVRPARGTLIQVLDIERNAVGSSSRRAQGKSVVAGTVGGDNGHGDDSAVIIKDEPDD